MKLINTEKLYFGSPAIFQNLMVSTYGAILDHRRYGGKHRKYVEELNYSQWYSPEKMRKLQDDLFLKSVNNAFFSVPFYREWSRNTGIRINHIS